MMTKNILLPGLLALCGFAQAADLRVDVDGRVQPQLADEGVREGGALVGEFTFQPNERFDGLTQGLDFIAYGRYEPDLDKHSHFDIRELIYTLASRDYEARAGIGRTFWGVTEGAHLVDVINQDDWLENIDGEDKLGQPWVSFAWTADWGIWRAYVMPLFREREFPDRRVLPIPFPVDEDEARYESAQGDQHPDYALRWKHLIGDVDIGLSWFRGTNREPMLLPCARQGSGRPGTEEQANCDLDEAFGAEPPTVFDEVLIAVGSGLGLTPSRDELEEEAIQAALDDVVLVPFYEQMQQFGLELQWITGGWALKFEGRRRELTGREEHAAAAGFEYTQGSPFGWPADFGYVMEYLYDDRAGNGQFALLNNELLLAWRGTFSDVAGTQILAGVLQDLDNRGRIYSIEASRRLGDMMSVGAEVRVYSDIPADDPLAFLSGIDKYRLLVSYYF